MKFVILITIIINAAQRTSSVEVTSDNDEQQHMKAHKPPSTVPPVSSLSSQAGHMGSSAAPPHESLPSPASQAKKSEEETNLNPTGSPSSSTISNHCEILNTHNFQLGSRFAAEKRLMYKDLNSLIKFVLYTFANNQVMKIEDSPGSPYIRSRGQSGMVACASNKLLYDSLLLDKKEHINIEAGKKYITDLAIIKVGSRLHGFRDGNSVFNKEELGNQTYFMSLDAGVPYDQEFMDKVSDGLYYVLISQEGLTLNYNEPFFCPYKPVPQLIQSFELQAKVDSLLKKIPVVDSLFEAAIVENLIKYFSSCSENILQNFVSQDYLSYSELEVCTAHHNIEKRNAEKSLFAPGFTLLNINAGEYNDNSDKIMRNFRKLHEAQVNTEEELGGLQGTLKILFDTEKTTENNVALLKRSLIYTALQERIFSFFAIKTLYNNALVNSVSMEIERYNRFLEAFMDSASKDFQSQNLVCNSQGCSHKAMRFITKTPEYLQEVSLGRKLAAKPRQVLSCYVTNDLHLSKYHLQPVTHSRFGTIQVGEDHVTRDCIKDSVNCPAHTFNQIQDTDLVNGNFFISIRNNQLYIQCVNHNTLLGMGDGSKQQCTLKPIRVIMPITDLNDDNIIGFNDFLHVLSSVPTMTNLTGHLNEQLSLLQYLYKFTNRDITMLLSDTFKRIGNLEELSTEHLTLIITSLAVLTALSPCLAICLCVICKTTKCKNIFRCCNKNSNSGEERIKTNIQDSHLNSPNQSTFKTIKDFIFCKTCPCSSNDLEITRLELQLQPSAPCQSLGQDLVRNSDIRASERVRNVEESLSRWKTGKCRETDQ